MTKKQNLMESQEAHTHTHTNLVNHVSTSSAHLGERVACWEH